MPQIQRLVVVGASRLFNVVCCGCPGGSSRAEDQRMSLPFILRLSTPRMSSCVASCSEPRFVLTKILHFSGRNNSVFFLSCFFLWTVCSLVFKHCSFVAVLTDLPCLTTLLGSAACTVFLSALVLLMSLRCYMTCLLRSRSWVISAQINFVKPHCYIDTGASVNDR